MTLKPDLTSVLRALAPDAAFSIDGGSTIVRWESATAQPTEAQIQAELARQMSEWDAFEYARLRQSEYPGIDDLIVALWEQTIEGRPASAADLQVLREQIKQKYPKPT